VAPYQAKEERRREQKGAKKRAQTRGKRRRSDDNERRNFLPSSSKKTHEVHSDRRDVGLRVGVVRETQQQARLADPGVPDEEELFVEGKRSGGRGEEKVRRDRCEHGEKMENASLFGASSGATPLQRRVPSIAVP